MKPIRRAIDEAFTSIVIKPLFRRWLARRRRAALAYARLAVADRIPVVLPTRLLEIEVPRIVDRRSGLRWLVLAAIVAATATLSAFAISALIRRQRARAAAGAPVEPVAILVEAPVHGEAVEPEVVAAAAEASSAPA